MNARIEQLATQARNEINEINESHGMSDAYNTLVMRRFAELIIKECVALCDDHSERKIDKQFGIDQQ